MLIFDSGVGGLSILKHIKKILPKMNYIYLMDNQFFPYGNKNEFFIIERMIKIINVIKKKYSINIVIIACNTASTISLSILKKQFNCPIFGVFPNILCAQKITKNKIIGLIATKATINSSYVKKIIYKYSFLNTIKIISTNQLAKIAEKKMQGLLVSNIELKKIFKPWINLLITPDTIILGCTHFALLKYEIKKIFDKQISFVDSGETITKDVKKYCSKQSIHQDIKKNIFLYSKKNKKLKKLTFFLKKYKFKKIKHINLK